MKLTGLDVNGLKDAVQFMTKLSEEAGIDLDKVMKTVTDEVDSDSDGDGSSFDLPPVINPNDRLLKKRNVLTAIK